jgi:hypothetical protein
MDTAELGMEVMPSVTAVADIRSVMEAVGMLSVTVRVKPWDTAQVAMLLVDMQLAGKLSEATQLEETLQVTVPQQVDTLPADTA